MAVSSTTSSTSTTSSSTVSGGAAIAENFDQFLSLLTTQLKNQSPLDPLDTNQFTQQLVQFAGVEQQLRTNETLTSLLSLSAAGTATNAVGFVGTTITTDGATTRLEKDKAEWQINAPRGGLATITIKDSKGSVVQTLTKTLTAGDQTYSWDGTTSTAQKAADGEYTITVDAKDTTGAAMTATTKISGVVDGVDFTGSIPMLKIGAISVPLDKVKSVVRAQ
ncbi:MAG TPA: flagellar hook capping FlgD N-terminal domain-containing protein [Bosea sp. (in: a-proteobacteria)]|jgi:flagellar basal-body rod modification protein FlgD|uniref:flagellar hook assembly protein FlgD n=1 Tax=Bosea sp. (in: a-proteobacteria) TaxID=1871050 RepID=UPI002DDD2943|nr:flagellar hook capping FlgD N-terminal domain-containing protein [Bosea sp. (in: a-proteobacteria)]HEV2552754.1 flagellar hook capping FlgD N-terminal domain-containing protein [Bosea sp. (in: a-proteobacteria)]